MTTRTSGDVDAEYRRNPNEAGKWISGLVAMLGAWMIAHAYLFDMVVGQFWSDVIAGVVLLVVGGYNYARRARQRLGDLGAAVLTALIGVWILSTPFMFGADGGLAETTNDVGFWTDVVVGLLAIALGSISVYRIRDGRRKSAPKRTAQ